MGIAARVSALLILLLILLLNRGVGVELSRRKCRRKVWAQVFRCRRKVWAQVFGPSVGIAVGIAVAVVCSCLFGRKCGRKCSVRVSGWAVVSSGGAGVGAVSNESRRGCRR